MKKVFTIISAIVFSAGAFAQQVPNGGFEIWSSSVAPDDWGTLGNIHNTGSLNAPNFAFQDTTTYVEGHSSIRIVTDTLPQAFGGVITPGIATVGILSFNVSSMQYVFPGYPYTKKPDSLYFSVKYTPAVAGDSGQIAFTLNHAGTSIIGGYVVENIPSTQGQWVSTSIKLTPYYTGSTLPDTMILIFQSSNNPNNAPANSTLWVDNVHFDASVNVTGIETVGPMLGVNAYPNPAADLINITIQADEIGSQIQLFDMEGRMVYSDILSSTRTAINTSTLQSGVYAIRVNSIDKLTTYKGKITVSK